MRGRRGPGGGRGGGTREGGVHAERLSRLREKIREAGLDGLLVGHLPNIRYLSGFTGSSALLVVLREGEPTLLTDFRYEEQAADQTPLEVRVWIVRDGLFSELAEFLDAGPGPRRLGFEADHLTVRDRREIGERCGSVDWEAAPALVEEMRSRKDEREVARIREAAGIAERAFGSVLEKVEVGVSERELAAELEYRLRVMGSGSLPFEPIVAGGPRSSLPHAEPGERRLQEGDLLLFDFGATSDGYCCDLTRTVVLGAALSWQREVHDAVREAQRAAIEVLRPGVTGREVDGEVRRLLEERGLGDRFGHSTGHGIGLEVHESPRLSRRSEEVLEAGHVVTVEPGVYLPGRGGVRIEDDVVVEEDGPRLLTGTSRHLLEI